MTVAAESLVLALRASQRALAWGPVDDPVAQDVLAMAGQDGLTTLAGVLRSHGLGTDAQPLTPLSGGVGSVVLASGDRVVRLGLGASQARAPIPEMLQPLARGQVGLVRYEVLPRLRTDGITPAMVRTLQDSIAARGYAWTDVGEDNVGRDPNDPTRLYVLDPGGVDPCPGTMVVMPLGTDLSASDREAASAWLRIDHQALDLHLGWVSLAGFQRQIDQAQASYPSFPKESARTRRIVRALARGEPLQPLVVERGDPSLFVMEGRHRMVAFTQTCCTEVPIAYVSRRSPTATLDMEAKALASISPSLSPPAPSTVVTSPRRRGPGR